MSADAPDERPRRLWLVAGTGTEVGKTWVACALLRGLRAHGLRVAARKPAQSFEPSDAGRERTDAHLLGRASGERPLVVCPAERWYEVAMAPPMAAVTLGRPPITIADLVAELAWPEADVGVVETVGGARSPLASDGDAVALAEALRPDLVVLVADAGLGTINAVRLTAGAFRDAWPLVVVLNRWDGSALHHANQTWLTDHDGFAVVTSPDALVEDLALSLRAGGQR